MYLVTGGGGFIGAHLVRALVGRSERVRVLDNGSSGGPWRVGESLAAVEWIEGDIRDQETVRRACAGVDVVLHHAAVASVPRSIAEPEMTHACNVDGTLNVLIAARTAGVRRVVFASSSAVYGDQPTSPKAESLPLRPLSPYGAHKVAGEAYCQVWQSLYELETVALRYFNVFGPGQDPQSEYAAVIPRFINAALTGHAPTIYGDGEQSRDFIYVGNVVEANLLSATVPAAAGAVLNVGSGISVTLNQLVAEIGQAIGRELRPQYAPNRPGDVRESLADITRLHATLDYTPTVSFSAGLAQTVAAFASTESAGHAS